MSKILFVSLILSIAVAACGGQPPSVATSAPIAVATVISTRAAQPTTAPQTQSPTQASAAAQPASSSIACTSPASITPAMTEGPYYKANAPQRASLLEPNMKGIKLVVTGYVLTTDCKPVARAKLDFWQADASGQYDNTGYILRGHQYKNYLICC